MRRITLSILLACAFALPVRAQDPVQSEYQAAFDKGLEAITGGRYDEGIAAFEKCLLLNDADSASAYNLACCHALKGSRAEGLQWLRRAFQLGFTDADHAERDGDLGNLHEEPGYAELIAEMRAAAGKNAVRDYAVHVPAALDPAQPAPLLVALHGANGNPDGAMAIWKPLAEEHGLLLVAVRGTVKVSETAWRWDERSEAVVLSIVREVQASHKVDAGRVYLAGNSQGAYFAYSMGMHSPDLFRAVLAVGGLYPAQLEYNFPEAKKHGLGVFILQGAQDAETRAGARTAAQKMKEAGVAHEIYEHSGAREVSRDEWPAVRKMLGEFLDRLGGR